MVYFDSQKSTNFIFEHRKKTKDLFNEDTEKLKL